jgi:hypothetical protein
MSLRLAIAQGDRHAVDAPVVSDEFNRSAGSAPMRIPLRTWAIGVVLAVAASALVALWSPSGMDYLAPSCVNTVCDHAGPSIEALSHRDLKGFFANQPPMGSFSLLVRTPPAIVANLTVAVRAGALRGAAAAAGERPSRHCVPHHT